MKVENKNDRQESPEECDACGSPAPLKRYYYYGPGHQVEWACGYCAKSFIKGEPIGKTLSAMFNHLEAQLKGQGE